MGDRAANTLIISCNIKRLREEAGWSQADLAKESGVSPAAISLIEKGERIPSLIVTRKLATAFTVSEAEITGAVNQSAGAINKETQAFFRNWRDLEELDDVDKEIIRNLAKGLKKRNDDKSGK